MIRHSKFDTEFLSGRRTSSRRPILLLGTAIGSTLFFASPSFAAVLCGQAGPSPIFQTASIALVCVNNDDRVAPSGEDAISLSTTGNNSDITLTNTGHLTATASPSGGRGIFASTNGIGADITINNSGAIDSSGHAIMATDDGSHTGTSDDTHILIINSGGIQTGEGAGLMGRASYGTGNVVEIRNTGAITTGANLSEIGGSTGIFASVGGNNGLATVTNDGAITTEGDTAAGISAVASYYHGNNSDIVINNGVHGTIIATSPDAFGIFASAGSVDPAGGVPNANNDGTVIINNAASVNAGYHGIGAYSYGTNGTITLGNTGAVTSTTGASLLAKSNNDNADINITNSGRLTAQGTDPLVSHGIYAATNGVGADITIKNTGEIDSNGHAIMATDDGAHTGTSNDTYVSITNSGKINTGKGAGLYGRASYGSGNVVEIVNTGAITTGVNTSPIGGATAIFASVGGNGGLAKVTNDGVLTTVGDTAAGISVVASYYHGDNSNIIINNGVHGTIIANAPGAFGIFASAGSVDPTPPDADPNPNNGGTIVIDNAASITSGYHGIGAYTYGTGGDITLTNSGRITTTGTSDSNGIVAIANASGAVVSVVDSGAINALGFGIVAQALGAGSSLSVDANADVYGAVGGVQIVTEEPATLNVGVGGSVSAGNNLAVSASGGPLTINNRGAVYGRLELGDDYVGDTFNNLSTGYFRVVTDSDFGDGADVVNNSGVIDASGGGTGNKSFVALETLNNTGGLVSLVDNHAGDHFTTSGNFVGSGTSLVGLDVDFSNPGAADVYTIQGNSSGTTRVVINPTGITPGTPHVGDIGVIVVNGTTSEPDFDLAGGPVNAGFYAYDLFLDGNTHELRYVGLGNAAYELPAGVTGAQDLWQDGFNLWQDRIASARDHHTTNVGEPAAWIQAMGSWSHLDPSITFEASGRTETLNLDNSQSMGGVLAGVDLNTGSFNGGDVIVGATAGYVTSLLDFDATDDFWQYRGASLGAYASFLKDGFFVNGAVKLDLLRVSINNRQGAVVSDADTSATSFGGRVDVGYRMNTGWGFLEPKVSLQGARTWIGDVSLFGSDVTFQDGTSGRVTAALRVGTPEIDRGDVKIAPSLTFSIWDDLGGMNTANIGAPISTSTGNNPGSALFGGISANVDFIGRNGWSGGLQASFKTSSDTQGGSLGASLHFHW
ncbi:MAG TPA: pertactin-like passenger domain-containing protein [Bauldia sp.]|nr:pertactin-like passenger domain-containing protein [Bauldia sp.]